MRDVRHRVHLKDVFEEEEEENGEEEMDTRKEGKIEGKKHIEREKFCQDNDCEECKKWCEHQRRYHEAREAYEEDKNEIAKNEELSADM